MAGGHGDTTRSFHVPSGRQRYTLLIDALLRHTALRDLLGGSVGQHIERAKRQMEDKLSLPGPPFPGFQLIVEPARLDELVSAAAQANKTHDYD
jgi:hypothetical protein